MTEEDYENYIMSLKDKNRPKQSLPKKKNKNENYRISENQAQSIDFSAEKWYNSYVTYI